MTTMLKFLFWIEADMREWLETESCKRGVSMAQVLRDLIATAMRNRG